MQLATPTPPKPAESKAFTAIYNGKEIGGDDFKQMANRVSVNLATGDHGYVRSKDGKLFEISTDKRMAVPVKEMRTREQREIANLQERLSKARSQGERDSIQKRIDAIAATPPQPKPAEPARYSLGGKLAPGRGTEERQDVAYQLKLIRRQAKTSMLVAEKFRPTEWVDKYGGGSGIMVVKPFDANAARREVYSRMNLTRDYEKARRKAKTLTRKANKLAR